MTDIAVVMDALVELSRPWPEGDKVKRAIERAAARAGLTYTRAFDIWYGKARRIEQSERDAIAAAIELKRKEAARNDIRELRLVVERAQALLAQIDQDFNREALGPLGNHLRPNASRSAAPGGGGNGSGGPQSRDDRAGDRLAALMSDAPPIARGRR